MQSYFISSELADKLERYILLVVDWYELLCGTYLITVQIKK